MWATLEQGRTSMLPPHSHTCKATAQRRQHGALPWCQGSTLRSKRKKWWVLRFQWHPSAHTASHHLPGKWKPTAQFGLCSTARCTGGISPVPRAEHVPTLDILHVVLTRCRIGCWVYSDVATQQKGLATGIAETIARSPPAEGMTQWNIWQGQISPTWKHLFIIFLSHAV